METFSFSFSSNQTACLIFSRVFHHKFFNVLTSKLYVTVFIFHFYVVKLIEFLHLVYHSTCGTITNLGSLRRLSYSTENQILPLVVCPYRKSTQNISKEWINKSPILGSTAYAQQVQDWLNLPSTLHSETTAKVYCLDKLPPLCSCAPTKILNYKAWVCRATM